MQEKIEQSPFLQNIIPVILAFVVLGLGWLILFFTISTLNHLPFSDIVLKLKPADILVGLTIYLKTSIDFAIFMGMVMSVNPGWRARIAIETGTAAGNLAGTLLILIIWVFFKEIKILLSLMIIVAALVLFRLAQDGLDHVDWDTQSGVKKRLFFGLEKFLAGAMFFVKPVLKRILPKFSLKDVHSLGWGKLLLFTFTIPFILGMDDFAGYISIFNLINVLGFATGVLVGHTLLNLALFISPSRTVAIVKNSYVAFLGSLAFVGLAVNGLVEAVKILIH